MIWSVLGIFTSAEFNDFPTTSVFSNNESITHFSRFISVTVKKNVRKFQDQFRETLRN